MAKGKYLGLQRCPAPEERQECGEDGQKSRRHRGVSFTHRARKFNDYGADGILGRDRQTVLVFFAMPIGLLFADLPRDTDPYLLCFTGFFKPIVRVGAALFT